jgi:hypothetical protein
MAAPGGWGGVGGGVGAGAVSGAGVGGEAAGAGVDGGTGVGADDGAGTDAGGGDFGGVLPTGAPHISQKLLPGSSWAPQLAQVSTPTGAGPGTLTAAGGVGTAACGGEIGAAYPKAAPQLSQKASPGVTDVPHTGQVVLTTVGGGCGGAAAGGAAAGTASSSFAPHSSQKDAPSGCWEPQFIHTGMVFLLAVADWVPSVPDDPPTRVRGFIHK